MGPSNVALVKLFEADQKYRQAQGKYDAASRDVRIQERRVNELVSRLNLTSTQLKEMQAKAGNAELDIKTREQKIERLREQQQTAKNNKEYQAFLIEINTNKVDKSKAEDELLKLMEQVEKTQAEVVQVTAMLSAEKQKHESMAQQITEKLEVIKKEIADLKPARDAAAAAVPTRILENFDRLCERFEGEALAPMTRPDRRVEEYNCGVCNMSMAVDIYNRLHSRDEPMFCPSCRRFLYIPEDLGIEQAIIQKKKPRKGAEEEKSEATGQADQNAAAPQA